METKISKKQTPFGEQAAREALELVLDGDASAAQEGLMKFFSSARPAEALACEMFMFGFAREYYGQIGSSLEALRKHLSGYHPEIKADNYQFTVGCNERVDYCRANICMYTNPLCSTRKLGKVSLAILSQINDMYERKRHLVEVTEQRKNTLAQSSDSSLQRAGSADASGAGSTTP
ncbi:MAG: hypothetical protein H6502_02100 [Candidatus Woesearchaeota archaeon]|nr:MAG: hypothetical protein H6502_02100 [Candidatus Woesearchaeota archaeon]